MANRDKYSEYVKDVADAFGVAPHLVQTRNRAHYLRMPRDAAYFVLRTRFPALTVTQLGAIMGGWGRASVSEGIARLQSDMLIDDALRAKVYALAGLRDERLSEVICAKRAARRACAQAFGLPEHRLVSRSRKAEAVIARQACCLVLKTRFPEMSYPAIGRMMGGRDHSTILYSIAQAKEHMARNPEFRAIVNSLIRFGMCLPHDAHVVRWRKFQRERLAVGTRRIKAVTAEDIAPRNAGEIADFDAGPKKVWCGQCDHAVPQARIDRCKSQFCPFRRAA